MRKPNLLIVMVDQLGGTFFPDGGARTAPVLMEYAPEGSYAPLVAIREGDWKYVRCTLGN